jgi:hypothetical protein
MPAQALCACEPCSCDSLPEAPALRRLDLVLLVGLAGIYEERGENGAAIEALTTVTAEEPAHEEAHAALMRLYALSGRRTEALRQYESLEGVLFRELGVGPNASSRALREEIASNAFPLKGMRSRGIPLEEPASVGRHNLPATRSGFVGRETELRNLKRDLAMTRLLTQGRGARKGDQRVPRGVEALSLLTRDRRSLPGYAGTLRKVDTKVVGCETEGKEIGNASSAEHVLRGYRSCSYDGLCAGWLWYAAIRTQL